MDTLQYAFDVWSIHPKPCALTIRFWSLRYIIFGFALHHYLSKRVMVNGQWCRTCFLWEVCCAVLKEGLCVSKSKLLEVSKKYSTWFDLPVYWHGMANNHVHVGMKEDERRCECHVASEYLFCGWLQVTVCQVLRMDVQRACNHRRQRGTEIFISYGP